MSSSIPFPNSYWVSPRHILAGEYPTLLDPAGNRQRVRQLLNLGIQAFLDLTEPQEVAELQPYLPLVQELAHTSFQKIEWYRLPIADMHVPSVDEMRMTLDQIDSLVARNKPLYIHCWGGIGRTGTVVGCYLVRHGMSGQDAIEMIAQLRQYTPDYRYPAPARDTQRQMVHDWRPEM